MSEKEVINQTHIIRLPEEVILMKRVEYLGSSQPVLKYPQQVMLQDSLHLAGAFT